MFAGASNDSGVVDEDNFRLFRGAISSKTLEVRPGLLYGGKQRLAGL